MVVSVPATRSILYRLQSNRAADALDEEERHDCVRPEAPIGWSPTLSSCRDQDTSNDMFWYLKEAPYTIGPQDLSRTVQWRAVLSMSVRQVPRLDHVHCGAVLR